MAKGYTVKFAPDPREPVSIKIHETLTYDESLYLTMMSLLAFMRQSTHHILLQNENDKSLSEEEKDYNTRRAIYDKTVVSFSHVVDEFFPEGKELKGDLEDFMEFLKEEKDAIFEQE